MRSSRTRLAFSISVQRSKITQRHVSQNWALKQKCELLTLDHLLLLGLDDGVVHGLGQGVVDDGLDAAQTLLVLGAVLLAHAVHDVPVDLRDGSVHFTFTQGLPGL